MPNIHQEVLIGAPAEKVYNAIAGQEGLSAWWTPGTSAKAEVGSVARFPFGPNYHKEMKITELKPYELVKWNCIAGDAELLILHHDNWQEYTAMFAECSYTWAQFLRSLKLLCETGKGLPYPYQHRTNP